jgi:D-sedoheptulose 7-phosphate isomerase
VETTNKQIKNILEEHIATISDISDTQINDIEEICRIIIDAFNNGNKLLIFGNGGSAADAQHIAAEFVNKFKIERKPLPALALTTDTSILTAISNDSGSSYIFQKQIEALGQKGDIALAITTSDISTVENDHSSNLFFGLKAARNKKMKTIGFISQKSKEILKYLDYTFVVQSNETPRIQEAHILTAHIICEIVEKKFAEKKIKSW